MSDANPNATEPSTAYPDAPVVKLGGKVWPIPQLAFKQLKVIQSKLGPLMTKLITNDQPIATLTDSEFCDLADVVYVGLTRAHPMLTRAEFDNMAGTPLDLVIAMVVVARHVYGADTQAPAPGDAPPAAAA